MRTHSMFTRVKGHSRVLGIALCTSLMLAACAPAQAPAPPAPAASAAPSLPTVQPSPTVEQPRYGGLLTITTVANPATLDTQQEPSANTSLVVAPAYNNLLYYDSTTGSKIVPELAEQWSMSSDGLSYTFKLRKGIKFHDGTPLTADDVVFNLNRMKSPPKGTSSTVTFLMTSVDRIESVSDDSVRLVMKEPFPPLPSTLVTDFMPMYSKAQVEKSGNMKTTVMGTGPFKLKSYTPGVSLEYVKNPDYWLKGKPYLDGITFLVIPDNATRLAALRTGQAKLSGRVFAALNPSQVATLKKDVPNERFLPSVSIPGPWFFMNLRKPPFQDARVRQAINLAVDRQAAIKIIAEGEGRPGNIFPFDGWGIPSGELQNMPGYRQPKDEDTARARKLLADAGYPNGFKVRILSRTNQLTKNAATFMTDQLSRIGIDATVEVLEDALFWDNGGKAQHEAMVYTPNTIIADPFVMGRFFAPKGNLNFSGNDSDQKLNDLWNKQLKTLDESARKAVIADLERYVLTELVPAVPLVWPSSFIAVAPEVRGFVRGANDFSNNRHQETYLAQ